MFNRPASQPAATPDAGIGGPSGNPEFGGATFTASLESNLDLSSKADVMGAHQYFQTGTGAGAESLGLGKMEITGLQPAGDSSVTAALIAKVNEAISPVIGMIMKLPGAMGFVHSLFEVLGGFLLGNFNLFEMLNPIMLGQHAAASFVKIGETLGHGLHSSLSLLPGHAPIFESMNSFSSLNFHGTADILSMKLNASLSGAPFNQVRMPDTFTQKLNGLGSMNKPAFETSSSLGHEGVLSGPSLTGHSMADQMAGHTRLFTENVIGNAGKSFAAQANPMAHVPAATAAPAAAPSPTVASVNSMPSSLESGSQVSFQDAGYKMSSQSADLNAQTADLGPSGRVPEALANNKIASNFSGSQGSAQAASQSSNGLSGMKAKQLSFENLQGQSPVKADVPVAKAAPAHVKPQLADATAVPKHIEVPKGPIAPKAHLEPKAHVAPKAHGAPKVEAPVQAQSEVAPAPESMSEAQAQAYTVQRGDNLWNLAKNHLGDGKRWNEIYDLNKDVIGSNPDLIHTGTQINLPGANGSELARSASASTYTVQPGDNLWNLSSKFTGDGRNWGDLYNMNKDVIGANPRMLHPGQQLQIGSGDTLAGAPDQTMSSTTGAESGAVAPDAQMQAPSDAQMQQAQPAEAMTPQVESMAPATNPNTVSYADPASAATATSNTAYTNSGAAHAATLNSPVSMSMGKDLKELFKS